MPIQHPRPRTVASFALSACVLLAAGCGGGSPFAASGPTLSAGDFAAPATQTPAPQIVLSEPSQPERTPPPAIELARPNGAGAVYVTTPGAPTSPTSAARAAESPVLIDAKVGDINGRPIYADDFLDPMSSRLAAEATRMAPQAWQSFARNEIRGRITSILWDELMRAEAIASLTPEQKQGLRAFLQTFRQAKVRESRGSVALAERQTLAETGKSLDQALKEEEQKTLVRLTFQEEINKRVNVSWRDVELRYEQDIEKYRPPPTARFRLIRVPTEDTQEVEMVRAALDAGEDFAEVASREENSFNAQTGGLHEARFDEPYEDGEFFGGAALNEQARTLAPGQRTEAFELGSYTCWLKLEGVTRDGVDLYDAQLDIYQQLLAERQDEEFERFINRLVERARVTDLETIEDRLVEIATRRYGSRGG